MSDRRLSEFDADGLARVIDHCDRVMVEHLTRFIANGRTDGGNRHMAEIQHAAWAAELRKRFRHV